MPEKRQFELHLLRYHPFVLKDDFLTVGLMLVEEGGRFAEVRFTHDWRMMQCVAPDVEVEWFAGVEGELRSMLKNVWRRENLEAQIFEQFGDKLEMAPSKAVLTSDPVREMEVLAGIYLAAPETRRTTQPTGRAAIRMAMKDGFERTGVLELVQQNLDVTQYTGTGDPFRIDFGYRAGSVVKMFHAVSLAVNVDQALALAYRFSRIEAGMKAEFMQASLTAVVEEELRREESRIGFAIGMLEQSRVRVRSVGEMVEIAEEARRELRA